MKTGQIVQLNIGHAVCINCTILDIEWSREWKEYQYTLQPLSGGDLIYTWASHIS